MKIAVQIGTNDANDQMSKMVLNKGYDKIYLIEPHSKFNANIDYVYSDENYVVLNIAITTDEKAKKIKLYKFSDNCQHDSILLRKTHPIRDLLKKVEYISVPCMTFMQFCKLNKITEIDFLYIDAEGLDSEIINSIDLDKIKINRIIWERWAHEADDENGRYKSGFDIEYKVFTELINRGYRIKIQDVCNYSAERKYDKSKYTSVD